MNFKTDAQIREAYIEAKKKYDERKAERTRTEFGVKIFDELFNLNFISDDYDVFPQESYYGAQSRFIEEFIVGNDIHNERLIKELRVAYINDIEEDIEVLQKRLNDVKKQYEGLKK